MESAEANDIILTDWVLAVPAGSLAPDMMVMSELLTVGVV